MVAASEDLREIRLAEVPGANSREQLSILEERYVRGAMALFKARFAELEGEGRIPFVRILATIGAEKQGVINEQVVFVPGRLNPGERLVVARDEGFYAISNLPNSTSVYDGIHHRALTAPEIMTHATSALDVMERLRTSPSLK